ncbi:MAG: AMP-binding protein [Nitrospirota bacterium]|jgi:long-chain acyl-CoA synthetase
MYTTLPEMFAATVAAHGHRPAFKVKDGDAFRAITFAQLDDSVRDFAAGLIDLGVETGEHVGLIADNCLPWIISDLAILQAGAADVPRGSDSTADELAYILDHADVRMAVLENGAQLAKIEARRDRLPQLTTCIVMDEGFTRTSEHVLRFDSVVERGAALRAKGDRAIDERADAIRRDDLATIIYTSGTTGEPKGVQLSHGNLLHQVNVMSDVVTFTPEDRFLSLLPPWHSFERAAEYVAIAYGCSTAYTTVKEVGADLLIERPTYMASVPRIWESIYDKVVGAVAKQGPRKAALFRRLVAIAERYKRVDRIARGAEPRYTVEGYFAEKATCARARLQAAALRPLYRFADRKFAPIRAKTGGCLKGAISGGGALPAYVDRFFDAVGLQILEGYGLTETSPVLAVRLPGQVKPGTVGPVIPGTQVKIVGPAGESLAPGEPGVIHVKGPQVMRGYYKRPEATAAVLSEDGWFNTGDLGRLTLTGELAITGRAKDTIVLLGGENVEPKPIEKALSESPYVGQVMVVGQDRKVLGALVVPNEARIMAYCTEAGLVCETFQEAVVHEEIHSLFSCEIRRLVSAERGFKPYERVRRFALLSEPFSVGRELTHTLKMRRNVIAKLYAKEIAEMFE